ncbi:VWA domain-containing protein [Halosimplex halobium]|uniref:VWA domain-containing protein n=1 Tax=Halosimplex halobium TaxID=3396618 RepID=UPI003F544DE5
MIEYGGRKNPSSDRGESLSFAEIVGQTELKQALLAVAANDDLDGLLVQGEKGTAKSTAVRALADLLPDQSVVADCPYGCPPGEPARQCEGCRERADPPTAERPVPLVTLPLGATRERVVGTLSVADALDGDREFDPGLLARANRGILYVDEVNLLDDHLVDVLLDAAASGVNRVERDGVSVAHPAEFTLVGTMNPEEGDLRPQLRDRFALRATVTACEEIDRRVDIVDRALGRTAGDDSGESTDREGSADSGGSTGGPRDRLRGARERLPEVVLPNEFTREIAELCRDSGVDGHRGDIATARAARTLAALDGRSKVIESDVRRAAELALPHRLRSRPFEDAPDPEDLVDDHFDDGDRADGAEGSGRGDGDDDGEREDRSGDGDRGDRDERPDESQGDAGTGDSGGDADPEPRDGTDGSDTSEPDSSVDDGGGGEVGPDSSAPERDQGEGAESGEGAATGGAEAGGDRDGADDRAADDSGDATEGTPVVPGKSRAGIGAGRAPDLTAPEPVERASGGDGSGSHTQSGADGDGARVRSRRARGDSTGDVDAAASVRAASARGASSVESRDLRRSVRRSDAAALVVFVVDASASMRPAMRAAKGTVLDLLKDAYRERDEVAFVAFAGEEADVLLPPTDSVGLAARHLKDLPTGDRTPLPAGLRTACDVLDRADPAASVVVLVTDGRANVAEDSPTRETREAAGRLREFDSRVVVVDADDGDRSGLTDLVADETDGEHVPLSALSPERIDAAVDAARES